MKRHIQDWLNEHPLFRQCSVYELDTMLVLYRPGTKVEFYIYQNGHASMYHGTPEELREAAKLTRMLSGGEEVPEYVNCILPQPEAKFTYCGKRWHGAWAFQSLQHAMDTIAQESRLVPCPDCFAAALRGMIGDEDLDKEEAEDGKD